MRRTRSPRWSRLVRPARAVRCCSPRSATCSARCCSARRWRARSRASSPCRSDEVIPVLGAALTGAVVWNGITWWRGLPSSSGHALLGGLVGAALAVGGADAVNWGGFDGIHPGRGARCGGGAHDRARASGSSLVSSSTAARGERRAGRHVACGARSGPGQWIMSEGLALTHGANDAQKAVGVVALLLVAGGELAAPRVADMGRAGVRCRADRGDGARGLADRAGRSVGASP